MDFIGWEPSPNNIVGNTSCYAVFESPYEYAEITDSWREIINSIDDGTYKSKYRIGNYKPLDLGSEGVVNMQIVGFNKDDKANRDGKAPISWISEQLLNTTKSINSVGDNQYESHIEEINPWDRIDNIRLTADNHLCSRFSIKSGLQEGEHAKIKITVSHKEGYPDRQLIVNYGGTNSDNGYYNNPVIFKINEETLPSYYEGHTEYVSYPYGSNMVIECDYYSDLRSYLQTTFKNDILAENIRNALIPVVKYTNSFNNLGEFIENEITTDDIWIPSLREIYKNAIETDPSGRWAQLPESDGVTYSDEFDDVESVKRGETYWLRTPFDMSNFMCSGEYFTENNIANALDWNAPTGRNGIVIGFCT